MKSSIYQTFLYSIIRHILTIATGVLVTRGWIDAETADEFTNTAALQIAAGILTFAAAIYWSYKDKIMAYVKIFIAKIMPPTTPVDEIEKVAGAVDHKRAVAHGNVDSDTLLSDLARK